MRRTLTAIMLISAGAIFRNEVIICSIDQALDLANKRAAAVKWALFPWRDAVATVLVVSGVLTWAWPKIASWWEKPNSEQRR